MVRVQIDEAVHLDRDQVAGVWSEVRLDKLLKHYAIAEMVGIGPYRLPSSVEQ